MKDFPRKNLRVVGLFSHSGSGKTSIAEAMLYLAGINNRLGKVMEETALLDFEPEEKKRKSSIAVAVGNLEWDKHLVFIVDSPGDPNFITEAKNALRAVDSALFVVDAVDGVKVLTGKLWEQAQNLGLARVFFISRLDRERADFKTTLESIQKNFELPLCPLTIPLGKENNFKGVIDLIRMKAYIYPEDGSGKKQEAEIPSEMKDEAQAYREKMIEAIAESRDDLLEKYLEGGTLKPEEIAQALEQGIKEKKVFPILCGSGTKNIGIDLLLNFIVSYFPNPLERAGLKAINPKTNQEQEIKPMEDGAFCGLVFKTVADPYRGKLSLVRIFSGTQSADSNLYNATKAQKERVGQIFLLNGDQTEGIGSARLGEIVAIPKLKETQTGDTLSPENNPVVLPHFEWPKPVISFAVIPKTQQDEEKLTQALARLTEEDPTLQLKRDHQTNEFILSGMGQIHIEIALERMKRKFGVEVSLKEPKIPYLETIRATAKGEGKYRKQTGGRGQFGWCWLEVSPKPRGAGIEFEDAIFGGAIPRNYIPSVEKGVRDALDKGILAGYPVTDLKIKLYDGKYHEVDSSDMAFQIAGSLGVKSACEQAGMILLEPIMNVEVVVPDECTGDITGDLNRRRGRLSGVERQGNMQVIKAQVPLAEMLRYSPDLDSMTSGRGVFTMEFSHYEEIPAHIAEKIIAKAKKGKEQE